MSRVVCTYVLQKCKEKRTHVVQTMLMSLIGVNHICGRPHICSHASVPSPAAARTACATMLSLEIEAAASPTRRDDTSFCNKREVRSRMRSTVSQKSRRVSIRVKNDQRANGYLSLSLKHHASLYARMAYVASIRGLLCAVKTRARKK